MAELFIYVPTLDAHSLCGLNEWVAANHEASRLTESAAVFYDTPELVAAYDLQRRPGGAELTAALGPGCAVVLWPDVVTAFPTLADLLSTLAGWHELGVRILSPDFCGRPLDMPGRDGEIVRALARFAARRSPTRSAHLLPTGVDYNRTAPYGFRWVRDGSNTGKKMLHPDDDERADMRWAYDATEAGEPLPAVVATMREHKRKGRTGNPVTARVVEAYMKAEALLRALEEKAGITYESAEFVLPDGELRRRQWRLPEKYKSCANPGNDSPENDPDPAHSG